MDMIPPLDLEWPLTPLSGMTFSGHFCLGVSVTGIQLLRREVAQRENTQENGK